MKILAVGSTGSIGSLVVEEALHPGHSSRALVRSPEKARRLPENAEAVVGDPTEPDTLDAAVRDIDGIVFTHGSDGGGKVRSEGPRSSGTPGLSFAQHCLGSMLRVEPSDGSRLNRKLGLTNSSPPF